MSTPALTGIRVLDFTSLVPGPMATLLLAEAGAEVVKVERAGGEEMRSYRPRLGPDSANFALLNRGKASITVDLKDAASVAAVVDGIGEFDLLVEQFRPGVMERLGLGYERLSARHPGLIYCSITGYGQSGPRAQVAGHDLNYVAEAGLLDQIRAAGAPPLPHALVADIGGGAYPAVINILLALLARERSGCGLHLDVAMTDGVLPFLYWALAQEAVGEAPRPGEELISGGSPRYQVYATADARFVAAAPLEDRFWANFCELIELAPALRDDRVDPRRTIAAVAEAIAAQPAAHWADRFAAVDCCCCIVRSLSEALDDPQFEHRGLFARRAQAAPGDGAVASIPALPVPIDPALRRVEGTLPAPALKAPGAVPAIASRGAGR